jgi:hypothetical protein
MAEEDTNEQQQETTNEQQETQQQETQQQETATETEQKEETTTAEDWRDKELKRKHAKLKETERLLAEKDREIEDLRTLAQRPAASDTGAATTTTQGMSQEDVKREAARMVAEQNYNQALVDTNSAGQKAYGKDWERALENLTTLGTVDLDTMQGILATDAPHKVLLELGTNPAEYQRIMDLPPARRQTEFVKLSLKENKTKVSDAPEPVDQIKNRVTTTTELSDKDDDETWYAKRAAQRKQRQAAMNT